MSSANVFYVVLAILSGVAVPILASISSAYGQVIQNVHWASLTLCVVGFLCVLAIIILTGTPPPELATLKKASWWHFTAGCFLTVYIVTITFVAPKIGVGNAIIFVVVAQIITAIVIDHFGLLGASIQQIDWKRMLGVLFLILGVALAKS